MKRFAILEACLVLLPCGVWWIAAGLTHALPDTAGMFSLAIFFVCSFYFLPACFIAPSLFESAVCMMRPEGVLGWTLVVTVYSVLAIGIAAVSSYVSNRKKMQNNQIQNIGTYAPNSDL